MEIHNQLTPVYFLIVSIVLLIINILALPLKKQSWKTLISRKALVLSLLLVVLGLLYSETSVNKDWNIETYGFPQYILLSKSSIGKDALVSFGIIRFHYINCIQNLILLYLLINFLLIALQKKKN